jgi:hypothetical protein
MKIEIEAKELTALLDYIKEQRKPIGNADDLAKVIKEKLPEKTKKLMESSERFVKTFSINSGNSINWKC